MSTSSGLEEKVKLLGRYWRILERLIPKKEEGTEEEEKIKPTLNWLADSLKRDKSQVSRELNDLKRKGLVDYESEGRTKVWHLTEEGSILVSHLSDALKEIERRRARKADVEKDLWKVDQLLSLADDEGLDEDLRHSFIEKLFTLFTKEPAFILERSERLRRALESLVKAPATDYLGRRKMTMLSVSIVRLISNEKTKGWVLSLYPDLKKLLDHEEPKVQSWAASLLGDIARLLPTKRGEVIKLFVDKLFSPATELTYEPQAVSTFDPYRGEVAKTLRRELIGIFNVLPENEKIKLIDKFREKAKSGDEAVKLKAEWVLCSLI